MTHTFIVTVETDYTNIDAPTANQLVNEIRSNLEYDAHKVGIQAVDVRSVIHNYRDAVERSHEQ